MTTSVLRAPNRLAQTIAVFAVALVGTRIFVGSGVSVGHLVAFALFPLWLPVLRRYTGAIPLVALGLFAAVSGWWLTEVASATQPVSLGATIDASLVMVGLLGGVGVILWARELLPLWLVGSLFGAGMLITVVLSGTWDAGNPWKFGLGYPAMVIVLALVSRPGMRTAEIYVLLLFAAFSIATDSRYRFASLMIAAVLILWQLLPKPRTRRTSALSTVVAFGAIALVTYNLATSLLVEGYLGESAQERSIDQISRSGSLIVGGRPELAASVALFLEQPFGFGSGVFPTQHDISVAKTGMAATGYEPNNGYVEVFMFGNGFELHSVAGDLWAMFGLPGLAFVILCVVLTLRALGRTLADRAATGIVVFLCISTLWNVLFSPIYGSLPTLVLTLGLCLLPRIPAETSFEAPSSRMRVRALS